MTVETIQDAPAVEEEESFYLPEMCDGRQWIPRDCKRQADYRCATSCCGGIIWWCEECLFAWIEISSDYDGYRARCIFCSEWVYMCPEHIEVIGRIR